MRYHRRFGSSSPSSSSCFFSYDARLRFFFSKRLEDRRPRFFLFVRVTATSLVLAGRRSGLDGARRKLGWGFKTNRQSGFRPLRRTDVGDARTADRGIRVRTIGSPPCLRRERMASQTTDARCFTQSAKRPALIRPRPQNRLDHMRVTVTFEWAFTSRSRRTS